MLIIECAPRWRDPARAAMWHELRANECFGAARACFIESAFCRGSAQDRIKTIAEIYRAAGKGHLFRAEELRYDARGSMTAEQATRCGR
jgi:hypothetical protein